MKTGKASQGARLSLSSRQPRQSSPPTVTLRARGRPCLRPASSPSVTTVKTTVGMILFPSKLDVCLLFSFSFLFDFNPFVKIRLDLENSWRTNNFFKNIKHSK